MTDEKMTRPQRRFDAPLTEKDMYSFLPGIKYGVEVLPSEEETYKSDENAKAFLNALKSGTNVKGWDLHGLNLKGADMQGADLQGVNFCGANLMNVDLSDSNLSHADLSYAYLEGARLDNADLTEAVLKGVFVRNTSVDGAKISEKDKKYLTLLEWIVKEVEAGKIDIRAIPKEELRFLDLRMLDLSKLNIADLDLNAYVLDGINLMGVRIDKTVQMSLSQLYQTNLMLEKLHQKETQGQLRLLDRLFREMEESLERFSQEEKLKAKQEEIQTKNPTRPALRDINDVNSLEREGDEFESFFKDKPFENPLLKENQSLQKEKGEMKEAPEEKEAPQKEEQAAQPLNEKEKENPKETHVEKLKALEVKESLEAEEMKKKTLQKEEAALTEEKKISQTEDKDVPFYASFLVEEEKEEKEETPLKKKKAEEGDDGDDEDEVLDKIGGVSILTQSKSKPKKNVKVIS